MRACVLTVSDGVFHGAREDGSGDLLAEKAVMSGFDIAARAIVPDEADQIAAQVSAWTDAADAPELILVTGGTGFAPRDVTPEATEAVCTKMLPGFGEAMRAVSIGLIPTAILSRQTAGIRGSALIITLPGKPTAIAECLGAIIAAVPDCLSVIGAPSIELIPAIGTYRPH